MIHTLVSTRSLEFVYKMEIYKNSIDIEISEFFSDVYFIYKKGFSNSKTIF